MDEEPLGSGEWFANQLVPSQPDRSLDRPRRHRVEHIAVRDGGHRLRVIYTHGSTDDLYDLKVIETPAAVRVDLWLGSRPPAVTDADGFAVATSELRIACVDAMLEEPLGERSLVVNGPE